MEDTIHDTLDTLDDILQGIKNQYTDVGNRALVALCHEDTEGARNYKGILERLANHLRSLKFYP